MSLESRLDDLYRLPLHEFTAARNALAKTLTGQESQRVRALAKPTVVPWAVNQLFWQARHVYERLMRSGDALRDAQISALSGQARKKPDLQGAAESHRKALAEAVSQATRIAATDGVRLDADDLSRTLESLSLAAARPEHPGRLTEIVRPAGFEALAGVSPATSFARPISSGKAQAEAGSDKGNASKDDLEKQRAAAAAEKKLEQELAAKRIRAEADVKAAERALERAKAAEVKAREAHEQAERDREAAQAALAAARKFFNSNF